MNVTFSIITIVILVIVIIIRQIEWRELAIKWVGNNPEHAQVYIKAGDTIRTVEGERFYVGDEGQLYFYPHKKGENWIIPIGTDYPYEYIRGRRIIGLQDGRVIPSPLGFMDENQLAAYHESVTEISKLIFGKVVEKALDSVKPSKAFQWTTYLLIAAIVVGVGYYYFYYRQHQAAPEPPTPAAQQATGVPQNTIQIQPGQIAP